MKVFTIIVNTLLITAIVVVAGLALATMLPIPGKIEMKVVQSGSMEPTIHVGSIVVIRPEASYNVGDVVTFGADTKIEVPTTHRIISLRNEAGVTYLSTKGDANEDVDAEETLMSAIIGRVLFSVPYMGYLIDFARKPVGFILLIAVPAGLIVIHELWGIVEELRRRKKNASEVTNQKTDSRRDALFSLVLITAVAAVAGPTFARYGDTEGSLENLFSATVLDFDVDADATTSISLTLTGTGETNGEGFEPSVVLLDGSLPFEYRIEARITGGDPAFCGALQLKGSAPLFEYDGPLHELATEATSDLSAWPVELYLPEGVVVANGAVCMADLIYKGAQEGAEVDEEYHDEERLSLLITYQEPPSFSASSAPPEGEVLGDTTEEPLVEPIVEPEPPIDPPTEPEPPVDPPTEPAPVTEEPLVD